MEIYVALLSPQLSDQDEIEFVDREIKAVVLADSRTTADAAFEALRPGWIVSVKNEQPPAIYLAAAKVISARQSHMISVRAAHGVGVRYSLDQSTGVHRHCFICAGALKESLQNAPCKGYSKL